MEGLTVLRSLAQNHVDTLLPRLRDVCLALVQEVAPPLWACSLVLSLSLYHATWRPASVTVGGRVSGRAAGCGQSVTVCKCKTNSILYTA